ncbi:MAG: hypothetical protein QM760_18955 [Nibricoccus sp.]
MYTQVFGVTADPADRNEDHFAGVCCAHPETNDRGLLSREETDCRVPALAANGDKSATTTNKARVILIEDFNDWVFIGTSF